MLTPFIPEPRLVEIDHVDVGVPAARAYDTARTFDFGRSRLLRALFELRTLPDRIASRKVEPVGLRIDDITTNTPFRMLDEEDGKHFVIGAVGRFWQANIPFVDITPDTFAAFDEHGYAKVAWGIEVTPRGDDSARITLELRVGATDEDAWVQQRRYFRLIGPFSRFIRRHALHLLARELGSAAEAEELRTLPGDELLRDVEVQMTMGIDIAAPPADIWPWLVQMGCRRGGWYSYDRLDNGGQPSAHTIHPEWQEVHTGDMLPATPSDEGGFEVLRVLRDEALVLGGMYDVVTGRQIRFRAERPPRFWGMTWTFALHPLGDGVTRLSVRVRGTFSPKSAGLRQAWKLPIHWFMEREQLRNIKERAEALSRMPHATSTISATTAPPATSTT